MGRPIMLCVLCVLGVSVIVAACRSTGPLPTIDDRSWPAEPPKSAHGGDVSDLPTRHPEAQWLPILGPLMSLNLYVDVIIGEHHFPAILDTGAERTVLSVPLAAELELFSNGSSGSTLISDAHGETTMATDVVVQSLWLGTLEHRQLEVLVVGDDPALALIGTDVLGRYDLYIAADEGLVGLFPRGRAPALANERIIPMTAYGDGRTIIASAMGARGAAVFNLLIDSGATATALPARLAMAAQLDSDVRFRTTTTAVASEHETMGRFATLLQVGDVPVGRVLALSSSAHNGAGIGLLGNDVLMRHRTVVSFARDQLRMAPVPSRGATRSLGPGNQPCSNAGGDRVACIEVRSAALVDAAGPADLPGMCLQIDVDAAYRGETIELLIVALDDQGAVTTGPLAGGAIRAYLSVAADGLHHCFPLWRAFAAYDINVTTPWSLRWVRAEGLQWPCDPMSTRCLVYNGPLFDG